ncbi:hypothetical protein [Streptomyces sp. NPDC016845]|uniref:hypothetical protein n=1 Tax=Streptomyces sp. NPDC016845 TaxID=3364972 RepID=UPI00378CE9BA
MARLVFNHAERTALRADARHLALTDPGVAYVLGDLAAEGVDLDVCTDWEEVRVGLGRPPRAEQHRLAGHLPRWAHLVVHDVALEQAETMTPVARASLDMVLEAIAVDPLAGAPLQHGSVRQYVQGPVRIVYVPTALGLLVSAAYVTA